MKDLDRIGLDEMNTGKGLYYPFETIFPNMRVRNNPDRHREVDGTGMDQLLRQMVHIVTVEVAAVTARSIMVVIAAASSTVMVQSPYGYQCNDGDLIE